MKPSELSHQFKGGKRKERPSRSTNNGDMLVSEGVNLLHLCNYRKFMENSSSQEAVIRIVPVV